MNIPIDPIPKLRGDGSDFLMYQARYESLEEWNNLPHRIIKGGGEFAMSPEDAMAHCDKSKTLRIAVSREENNWR